MHSIAILDKLSFFLFSDSFTQSGPLHLVPAMVTFKNMAEQTPVLRMGSTSAWTFSLRYLPTWTTTLKRK